MAVLSRQQQPKKKNMGAFSSKGPAGPRTPVPAGITRVCVAGYRVSPYTGRARQIAAHLAAKHSDSYESWFYFSSGGDFYAFTAATFESVPFPEHLKGHASSPFCWLETADPNAPGQNVITPIGGCDHLQKWAKEKYPDDAELQRLCSGVSFWYDSFHDQPNVAIAQTAK
jgi:hypothetical protein